MKTSYNQLFFIFLFYIFLIINGCAKARNEIMIELIVPNEYIGLVIIRANVESGQKSFVSEGRVKIEVSTAGVAEIQEANPFLEWHQITVMSKSGDFIPVDSPPNELTEAEIGFRNVGVARNGNESWFLIGSEDKVGEAVVEKSRLKYKE